MKDNSNKSVSIIVPVYNAQKTIRKCLKSLTAQLYQNVSIIVIDDGSTDLSGKICDEFALRDARVHIEHKMNGGVMSARLTGISLLPEKGYTIFCDADDYLPSDAIIKMIDCITEANVDIVCGNHQRFLRNSVKLPPDPPAILTEKKVYFKEEIIQSILPSFFGITNFPGYMHGKIYKNSLLKSLLDASFPNIKFFQEDIAFNLLAVLKAEKIMTIPDIVYFYRIGGATHSFMPSFFLDCVALYNFKCKMIVENELNERLKYTTDVELKNEYATWLEMYCEYVHGNKTKMIIEIERCNSVTEIRSAISYPEIDHSGIPGFKQLVVEQKNEEIYKLICNTIRRKFLKRTIKRLIM